MILHSVSALLAALSLWIGPARATSFYIRPFSEFVKSAPNIVRGTLHGIQVENGINAEGGRTIYTYASVDVKESIKGSIQKPTIRVRKPGGTKDGVTLEIPGSPEFAENEDTVLFLSAPREDQSYEVTGMELGKFELSEEGGETYLKGGILGYTESDSPQKGTTPAPELSENRKPWTISQLRTLVGKQEGGTKSAPPSPVQDRPAELKKPQETAAPAGEHYEQTAATATEPTPSSSPGKLAMAGLFTLAIFFYFRRRT